MARLFGDFFGRSGRSYLGQITRYGTLGRSPISWVECNETGFSWLVSARECARTPARRAGRRRCRKIPSAGRRQSVSGAISGRGRPEIAIGTTFRSGTCGVPLPRIRRPRPDNAIPTAQGSRRELQIASGVRSRPRRGSLHVIWPRSEAAEAKKTGGRLLTRVQEYV